MPFRIEKDGLVIIVDSADEFLTALKSIKSEPAIRLHIEEVTDREAAARLELQGKAEKLQRHAAFASALPSLGYAYDLVSYVGYRESVEAQALMKGLGYNPREFGGKMTQISLAARKFGLSLDDVLIKDVLDTAAGRLVHYRLSDAMRKAMNIKAIY